MSERKERLALENKLAIVTGGAGGIGRCIALRFANQGARVVIADLDEKNSNEIVQKINNSLEKEQATFIKTDCGNEESIKDLMKKANEWGQNKGIQILINNAAAFVFGRLYGEGFGTGSGQTDRYVSLEDWNKVLGVNIIGFAKCIEHVLPYMQTNELSDVAYTNFEGEPEYRINCGSRGSIVNVSSVSGLICQKEYVPYSTSKAGILHMTRLVSKDLGKFNIRVNSVAPGNTLTPAFHDIFQKTGLTLEEGLEQYADTSVFGRLAAPEEIANAVFFLASDESSFMTGATMVVDGGRMTI